jgi:hypothetical protein
MEGGPYADSGLTDSAGGNTYVDNDMWPRTPALTPR